MIIFKEIEIEGFGSIVEPFLFKFKNSGLMVVRGPNGTGKTTMFSALSWAAYGKSLKDKSNVATWEHLRPEKFKGTRVKLTWEDKGNTYEVTRHLKYKKMASKLIFKCNGEVNDKLRDKKDIQAGIEKALGMSFELFKVSTIFGQGLDRITDKSGKEQKAIFDEAFQAGFINEARDNEKSELYQLLEDKDAISNEVYRLEDKLESLEEYITESEKSIKNFEFTKEEDINFYTKKIESVKQEISELEEPKKIYTNKDLKSKNKELKTLNNKLDSQHVITQTNLLNKIDKLQDQIVDLEIKSAELDELVSNTKPDRCHTCNGRINKKEHKNRLDVWNKEKLSYMEKLGKLRKEKSEIEDKESKISIKVAENERIRDTIKDVTKEIDKIEDNINSNNNYQSELTTLMDKVENWENVIKKTKDKTLDINLDKQLKLRKELKAEIKPLEKSIKKLEKKISLKQWLINDPLSNDGLKAFIFNQMLKVINRELSKLSRILGFRPEFGMSVESSRKNLYCIIWRGEAPILYEDLSGGQKQLVNIATAFAFVIARDLENPTNVLLMDEAFESLDSNNTEIVGSLIEEISKTKGVYLITHQENFNPRGSKTLHVSIDSNGQSKIF